jgi:hypothetical protein
VHQGSHRLRSRLHHRPPTGAWGHRAIYLGAVVATAAVVVGFGAALVIYGPVGTPTRQLSGTTVPVPPRGVMLGNAQEILASALNLTGAAGYPNWNWTNSSGAFTGPCNASGVLNPANGSYAFFNTNGTGQNLSTVGGNVTLVCLNSVGVTLDNLFGGGISATWYSSPLGNQTSFNTYNNTNFVADGSFYTDGLVNVSSCNQWNTSTPTGLAAWNATHIVNGSFRPCATYYEMNNNTTWIPSFGGQFNGTFFASGPYIDLPTFNNSTLWAPDELGYLPTDIVYELPVVFTNASLNGTYEISVAIQGVTPVAQTFYFNDTIGGTSAAPDTVLFVFDMTAAWLYDTTVMLNQTGVPAPTNLSLIYGAIGTTSAVVTECQGAYCPLAAPTFV